jgi:hypothetical protein
MKKGDLVKVQNTTASGKIIEEGEVLLIKPMSPAGMDNGQLWEVHFLNDHQGETYYRWIK